MNMGFPKWTALTIFKNVGKIKQYKKRLRGRQYISSEPIREPGAVGTGGSRGNGRSLRSRLPETEGSMEGRCFRRYGEPICLRKHSMEKIGGIAKEIFLRPVLGRRIFDSIGNCGAILLCSF